MIRNILFDLDGTLLPMDQDEYVEEYMKGLAVYFGSDPAGMKKIGEAMFRAVVASMKNTTDMTNEEMFWQTYIGCGCADLREDPAKLYRFYAEIHPTYCKAVKQGRNSRIPVEILKEKGYRVVLATNPVFPVMATRQRMSWAGLVPEDFELVTDYSNSHRCKPNPEYFLEVANALDMKPEECLVIGNDTRDDMIASRVGMKTYLVTDFLIEHEGIPTEVFRQGNFEDMINMVKELPDLTK